MLEIIREAPILSFHNCILQAKDGLYLEFGVHTGSTIREIAGCVTHTIYGFDSFQGLPEAWNDLNIGHFACEKPKVPENVILIEGWFDQTLPKFVSEHKNEKIAFIHIDCDLYSSTKCVFNNLKEMFQNGSVVCFDELIDYNDWENHEWKAWNEFLEETGYKCEVICKYGAHQVGFKIFK